MKIRIIVMSSANGEKEDVIFSDDFDLESSDFCESGMSISSDDTIDMDLPGGFPKNYVLHRD